MTSEVSKSSKEVSNISSTELSACRRPAHHQGSCHLPPEQTAMPRKGVEPVELPRQPEACWDAELTVPASLIFHFLNHSPVGTTLRSVSISSQTSPLSLLPFLPLVPKAVLWICFPPCPQFPNLSSGSAALLPPVPGEAAGLRPKPLEFPTPGNGSSGS